MPAPPAADTDGEPDDLVRSEAIEDTASVTIHVPADEHAPRSGEIPPGNDAGDRTDSMDPAKRSYIEAKDEMETPAVVGGTARRCTPEIRVLGPVEVSGWRQQPDRKVTTELAVYLALHAERARSVDEIRGAVWAANSDGGGRDVSATTLHQHLSRLRRCLGPDNLPEAGTAGYRLAPAVKADWSQFCELTGSARRADPDEVRAALTRALELVRGTPFAGIADRYDWAWSELLVSQMTSAIATAAHQLASLALLAGDAARARWASERGLLAVPTDESLHEDRMAAAVAAGDRHGFDAALSDAIRILGVQAEQGPLGRAGLRLEDKLRSRLREDAGA